MCLDPIGGYIAGCNRIRCDYPHLIVECQRLREGAVQNKAGALLGFSGSL